MPHNKIADQVLPSFSARKKIPDMSQLRFHYTGLYFFYGINMWISTATL